MTEAAAPYTAPRAYTGPAAVEALLDASFAAAKMAPCRCGAMTSDREDGCYPCSQGNRARGPIYGASLAGRTATGACRACAAANARIDDLLDQNDALARENSDLARQVVALQAERDAAKRALESLAAEVRAGKGQL